MHIGMMCCKISDVSINVNDIISELSSGKLNNYQNALDLNTIRKMAWIRNF